LENEVQLLHGGEPIQWDIPDVSIPTPYFCSVRSNHNHSDGEEEGDHNEEIIYTSAASNAQTRVKAESNDDDGENNEYDVDYHGSMAACGWVNIVRCPRRQDGSGGKLHGGR
jgi:hypothetical protein